jgi:hypothetical protein
MQFFNAGGLEDKLNDLKSKNLPSSEGSKASKASTSRLVKLVKLVLVTDKLNDIKSTNLPSPEGSTASKASTSKANKERACLHRRVQQLIDTVLLLY